MIHDNPLIISLVSSTKPLLTHCSPFFVPKEFSVSYCPSPVAFANPLSLFLLSFLYFFYPLLDLFLAWCEIIFYSNQISFRSAFFAINLLFASQDAILNDIPLLSLSVYELKLSYTPACLVHQVLPLNSPYPHFLQLLPSFHSHLVR